MALASIVTCMLMLAIGNSIAAGIGIAGGLSIIRFRTTMRDPRDMVFVFTALAAGIASGLQAYAAAIAGTAIFLVAALALDFTAFGARRHFDGLVRFSSLRRGRANSDRCASQSTLRLFRFGNTPRSRPRQTHGARLSDQCSQPRRPQSSCPWPSSAQWHPRCDAPHARTYIGFIDR